MNGEFNQNKIARVLKMMFLLSDTQSGYSIQKLSEITGVGQRSIYRYLNMFEIIGYQLEKNNNKFRITNFKISPNGNNQKGLPS